MIDVTLRPVVEEDLEVFFEHQRDPVANALAAFPARERDAFFEHWRKILSDPLLLTRTIVSDGEVDKTLEIMRRQRATYAVVERPARKDDRVTVDFVGSLDGVPFQGGTGTDFARH